MFVRQYIHTIRIYVRTYGTIDKHQWCNLTLCGVPAIEAEVRKKVAMESSTASLETSIDGKKVSHKAERDSI